MVIPFLCEAAPNSLKLLPWRSWRSWRFVKKIKCIFIQNWYYGDDGDRQQNLTRSLADEKAGSCIAKMALVL
ncbi:MAG: hypothetical protein HWQ35_24220 [Nostoc sp. NMS1]|uniref:hypothetical protein n=1 Tax=Nostoc sp. NMS1 TaxID=2815388 RepID=UPI0025F9CD11|nr:hypothetical protein [Nostoc sp. NMS1]MBN3909530.1 hypothetical protein [Nostoc sp. NMS1]